MEVYRSAVLFNSCINFFIGRTKTKSFALGSIHCLRRSFCSLSCRKYGEEQIEVDASKWETADKVANERSKIIKRSWVHPKTKSRKRSLRKKSEELSCVTFATADRYKMQPLIRDVLKDSRVFVKDLPTDFYNAANIGTHDPRIVCETKFPGEIFIFREGAISFWNIKDETIKLMLRTSLNHAIDRYPAHLVQWESEEMMYDYSSGMSKLIKDKLHLSSESDQSDTVLDMFAFSNALVVSVKLAHWEHKLDDLISSIETVPEGMIKGRKLMFRTSDAVLRKIGEILLIRHRVNLQYNLLDVPDTYWDHDNLEDIYVNTARFLNINRRVNLLNEKLTYCTQMAELLKTDLHEQKSLRVELLIVLLILFEVLFEIIHMFILPNIHSKPSDGAVVGK